MESLFKPKINIQAVYYTGIDNDIPFGTKLYIYKNSKIIKEGLIYHKAEIEWINPDFLDYDILDEYEDYCYQYNAEYDITDFYVNEMLDGEYIVEVLVDELMDNNPEFYNPIKSKELIIPNPITNKDPIHNNISFNLLLRKGVYRNTLI